jgi:hypothetical protein
MKRNVKWICTGMAVTILFCGCETTNREHTLAAAGFHTVVATTAQQKQQLQSLPSDRLTPLSRGQQTVFVFPDPKRGVLLVGREANYEEYRKLRLQQQIANENLAAAETWNDPAWAAWEPWGAFY